MFAPHKIFCQEEEHTRPDASWSQNLQEVQPYGKELEVKFKNILQTPLKDMFKGKDEHREHAKGKQGGQKYSSGKCNHHLRTLKRIYNVSLVIHLMKR